MQTTRMSWLDHRCLYRAICHSKPKAGEKLHVSGSITYSCSREQLKKKKLVSLGYNHIEFGLHSLQVGGAIKAATCTMGVPDRFFKCHG